MLDLRMSGNCFNKTMRGTGIFTDSEGKYTFAPPQMNEMQRQSFHKFISSNTIIWNGLIGYYSDGTCTIKYKSGYEDDDEIYNIKIKTDGTII